MKHVIQRLACLLLTCAALSFSMNAYAEHKPFTEGYVDVPPMTEISINAFIKSKSITDDFVLINMGGTAQTANTITAMQNIMNNMPNAAFVLKEAHITADNFTSTLTILMNDNIVGAELFLDQLTDDQINQLTNALNQSNLQALSVHSSTPLDAASITSLMSALNSLPTLSYLKWDAGTLSAANAIQVTNLAQMRFFSVNAIGADLLSSINNPNLIVLAKNADSASANAAIQQNKLAAVIAGGKIVASRDIFAGQAGLYAEPLDVWAFTNHGVTQITLHHHLLQLEENLYPSLTYNAQTASYSIDPTLLSMLNTELATQETPLGLININLPFTPHSLDVIGTMLKKTLAGSQAMSMGIALPVIQQPMQQAQFMKLAKNTKQLTSVMVYSFPVGFYRTFGPSNTISGELMNYLHDYVKQTPSIRNMQFNIPFSPAAWQIFITNFTKSSYITGTFFILYSYQDVRYFGQLLQQVQQAAKSIQHMGFIIFPSLLNNPKAIDAFVPMFNKIFWAPNAFTSIATPIHDVLTPKEEATLLTIFRKTFPNFVENALTGSYSFDAPIHGEAFTKTVFSLLNNKSLQNGTSGANLLLNIDAWQTLSYTDKLKLFNSPGFGGVIIPRVAVGALIRPTKQVVGIALDKFQSPSASLLDSMNNTSTFYKTPDEAIQLLDNIQPY